MMTVVDLGTRVSRYREPVPQEVAEALGAKLMAAAADIARQEAAFLELVAEFDALEAAGWWTGIDSTAHWLSWACSIAPGTAREHVRVARALRHLPLVRQAFATGDLTYSKVRELTRVSQELGHGGPAPTDPRRPDPGQADTGQADRGQIDPGRIDPEQIDPGQADPVQEGRQTASAGDGRPELDEAALVEFAQACTASQLARSVSGWRAAKGTSRARRAGQKVSWIAQDDGTIRLSAVLPAEEGAAVITAIQAATEANTEPEPRPGDEQPDDAGPRDWEQKLNRTRVEALAEICNHYLASRPDDRSGEDRTMVVVEISTDVLASAESAGGRSRGNAPDETSSRTDGEPVCAPADDRADGESASRSGGNAETRPDEARPLPNLKCRIRGGPAIEPAAAQAALCDSVLLGIITDPAGVPLAVGREQRLITKHQRRALMSRDHNCCQYPGCHRGRHLQAHHRLSWASGGATDLDNLILLCKHHHTTVHEDHIKISSCGQPGCSIPWRFSRPDGSSIAPTVAGLDAPSPWRPGRSSDFRRENNQLVKDWEAEQAVLQDHAERLRHAYDHVHHTDHPDARHVFPVGGGEGFRLVKCVDALFHFTEPLPRAA